MVSIGNEGSVSLFSADSSITIGINSPIKNTKKIHCINPIDKPVAIDIPLIHSCDADCWIIIQRTIGIIRCLKTSQIQIRIPGIIHVVKPLTEDLTGIMKSHLSPPALIIRISSGHKDRKCSQAGITETRSHFDMSVHRASTDEN